MAIELVFLGTSSMVPTKDRNHSAIYVNFKGEGILFDCGEGTQRQIKIAGIKPSSIKKLFISHWHGDHVLGIPGFIETLGHNDYSETLEIYGPKGTSENIKKMLSFFYQISKIKYKVTELDSEQKVGTKDYEVTPYSLNHAIPCLGYAFKEKDRRRIKSAYLKKKGVEDGPHLRKLQEGKDLEWKGKIVKVDDATSLVSGKKIGFVFDTKLTDNCFKIANEADVLISESTFSSSFEDNAKKFKHLTSVHAGKIAKESNAKLLYLTHFSQRFKDTKEILKEAKKEFKNTFVAEDFMKIKI